MPRPKKYKNPPLQEAIFEIFFEADNFSAATPGLFYPVIKNKYPEIISRGGGFDIAFDKQKLSLGTGGFTITQFKSPDNSAIIQLGNNLLTVNQLPPYIGWTAYKKEILEAVEALKSVVDIKHIQRIGLRAINIIDIGDNTVESLRKSLRTYPMVAHSQDTFRAFSFTYEEKGDDENEVLSVSLATLAKDERYNVPVTLQLNFGRIGDVTLENIEDWLDKAHVKLSDAFENSLTEECKETFNHA